jgi:ParE toxin of type II toxin-antitoxin system, parDE
MRVRVDLAAEADIAEIADFYDLQLQGLGTEVEEFLLECLGQLEFLAGIHPQCRGIYRQVISRGRFPYFVVYYQVLTGSEVLVRAVQDHRRDPNDIAAKIDDRFIP